MPFFRRKSETKQICRIDKRAMEQNKAPLSLLMKKYWFLGRHVGVCTSYNGIHLWKSFKYHHRGILSSGSENRTLSLD